MAAPLVNQKPPLYQAIVFAIIMFVVSIAWQTYKMGEFNKYVVFASVVGALVGGVIYGIIAYFRQRK